MVLVMLLAWQVVACAATSVSGTLDINSTWTAAQSPYVVDADVIIGNAAVLAIEPGVRVVMNLGTNLIVKNGSLRAKGTPTDPIVITSAKDIPGGAPAAGDWGQVVFLDQTNDANTLLEWMQIRFGQGLRLEQSSPTLNNLLLQNNAGPAISMDLKSSPSGVGLQAVGNTINGISVPAGEIADSVQWRLRGIPFVLTLGEVSVGAKPTITGIVPAEIQQGQTLDAMISGERLAGVEHVAFDSAGLTPTLNAGANDIGIPVRLVADAALPLGKVAFEAQTAAGKVRYEPGITIIAAKPSLTLDSFSPTVIRRGESKNFVLTGTYLAGALVAVPGGSGLSLSGLQTTATQANFTIAASNSATLGAYALTVTNPTVANGSPTVNLTVSPALPKVSVSPSPLAVPPSGAARAFLLQLSNADDAPHTVNLSLFDPTIATVSPATVTIPAGSSQASVNLIGLKQGYTVLNLTSSTLAAASESIYVTNLLNGATVGPVLSVPVGVDRQVNLAVLPVGTSVGPLVSHSVGVERRSGTAALPAGTSLGPLVSRAVGVERRSGPGSLPVGAGLGPLVSRSVGVERETGTTALPAGTTVGPLLSVPVGVRRQ